MESSIAIAHKAKMLPIKEIVEELGLEKKEAKLLGKFKAKVSLSVLKRLGKEKDGKLILVTAATPTRAGEGKTTVAIGLGQALRKLEKKAIICLREPSLGPVFGIKGGAAGGGYSQVLPMEEINLHFTGDIPAVSAANNLLAAIIDNYLYYDKRLNIDPTRITWKRALDMNDRSLRNVQICLEGDRCIPRKDVFTITAASEVMAVLCLAESIRDLKQRLGKMVIGYSLENEPITVEQLGCEGAATALLKQAIKPNLVQSIEHCPALVHGGPFANIAHGTNSVIATKMALKLAGYVVTEAGFGADLGCEKFFDIVCRQAKLLPNAIVLVASIRSLRMHGSAKDYNEKNLDAVKKGFCNLEKQIENAGKFSPLLVVAINKFKNDSVEEIDFVLKKCKEVGVKAFVVEFFEKGGLGGIELGEEVLKLCEKKPEQNFLYSLNLPIKEKITTIAKEMYGADGVEYSEKAEQDIANLEKHGFGSLPICVSKTQSSLSDDPKLLGRPKGFKIKVREVYVSAGAGFIVAITGKLITMPGLPEKPAALNIDISDKGVISGLF